MVFTESSVDGISVMFMYGYMADSSTTAGLAIISDPSSAVGRLISISKSTGYSFTITNLSNKNMKYFISVL